MVVKGPTNTSTRKLCNELEQASNKNKAPIWKKVAYTISKPTRQRPEVNLYKVAKAATSIVVVPGTVLAIGSVSKPVTVAAFKCSSKAREKIEAAKGKVITIQELLKSNPTGKDVTVLA